MLEFTAVAIDKYRYTSINYILLNTESKLMIADYQY